MKGKLIAAAVIALIAGAASEVFANGGGTTPWMPGPPPGGGVPCGAKIIGPWICMPATGLCVPCDDPGECTQYCKAPQPPGQMGWMYRCKSPTVTGGW